MKAIVTFETKKQLKDAFFELCQERGENPHDVIRELMRRCVTTNSLRLFAV